MSCVLAVAFERARGTSWQEIGDELGASRQAAHERYASVVDEIHEGILFPWRDGDGVMPGWWACPDGLEDPAARADISTSGLCAIANAPTPIAARTRSAQASPPGRIARPSTRSDARSTSPID